MAQGHRPTRNKAMQHRKEVAPGDTVTCVIMCAWQFGHTQFKGMFPAYDPGTPCCSTITTVLPPAICGPP